MTLRFLGFKVVCTNVSLIAEHGLNNKDTIISQTSWRNDLLHWTNICSRFIRSLYWKIKNKQLLKKMWKHEERQQA